MNHKQSRILSVCVAALLGLSACSTTPYAGRVANYWVGHSEAELLSSLGAPDSTANLPDGSKVCTWKKLWTDFYSSQQIGRQNFTINANGIVTSGTYQNMPAAW